MAITLNTSPSVTKPSEVGNCIRWEFTMTGIVSGTQVKRFGYKLVDGSGNAITDPESLTPKEGVKFHLDFERDILPFVHTEPPVHNHGSFGIIRSEDSMKVDVSLHFWEITHDTETCETTTGAVTVDGPYEVINSASNWFKEISSAGDYFLLTYKPKVIQACPLMQDFVYVYIKNPMHIGATLYGANGTVIGDRGPVQLNAGIHSVAVGPANIYDFFNFPDGAPNYVRKIQVTIGDDSWIYDMECVENTHNIYYQDFAGGYGSVCMQKSELRISSKYTEIFRYNPACNTYQITELQKRGSTISNKISDKIITLSKVVDIEHEKDLFYYESFLGSGSYFIDQKWFFSDDTRAVDSQMIKFRPLAGSLRYYENEKVTLLVLSGKVGEPHNLPNSIV